MYKGPKGIFCNYFFVLFCFVFGFFQNKVNVQAYQITALRGDHIENLGKIGQSIIFSFLIVIDLWSFHFNMLFIWKKRDVQLW